MLIVTPELMEGIYNMLRNGPIFSRWKLPESDEIEFKVFAADHFADWTYTDGKEGSVLTNPPRHIIRVSQKKHSVILSLIATMAHEMLHIHQMQKRVSTRHSAYFWRQADRICKYYGFERATF